MIHIHVIIALFHYGLAREYSIIVVEYIRVDVIDVYMVV
jgi:hypothetical protein